MECCEHKDLHINGWFQTSLNNLNLEPSEEYLHDSFFSFFHRIELTLADIRLQEHVEEISKGTPQVPNSQIHPQDHGEI